MKITRSTTVLVCVSSILLCSRICSADSKPNQRLSIPEMAHIQGIAFSPDGQTMITYSDSAIVWDLSTLKKLSSFHNQSGLIHSIAFSPDGKRVATGGEGAEVKVWEIATGEEIAAFLTDSYYSPVVPTGKMAVTGVAFTQDGTQLLTLEAWGVLQRWNLESRREVESIRREVLTGGGKNTGMVLFSDGENIMIQQDSSMILFSLREKKKIRDFEGALAVYLPSVNEIVTLRGDYYDYETLDIHFVRWNLNTGEEISSTKHFLIPREGEGIISADGRYAFLSNESRTSYTVYSLERSESITSLVAEVGEIIIPPIMTPDKRKIVSAAGSTLLFWNIDDWVSRIEGPITH